MPYCVCVAVILMGIVRPAHFFYDYGPFATAGIVITAYFLHCAEPVEGSDEERKAEGMARQQIVISITPSDWRVSPARSSSFINPSTNTRFGMQPNFPGGSNCIFFLSCHNFGARYYHIDMCGISLDFGNALQVCNISLPSSSSSHFFFLSLP